MARRRRDVRAGDHPSQGFAEVAVDALRVTGKHGVAREAPHLQRPVDDLAGPVESQAAVLPRDAMKRAIDIRRIGLVERQLPL
jgi:hypothetical protein